MSQLGRDLEHAQSLSELSGVLKAIELEQGHCLDRLQSLKSTTHSLQASKSQQLMSFRGQLIGGMEASNEIAHVLALASEASVRLSARVRAIEAEQTRVRGCLDYLDCVIDLKIATMAVKAAMEVADWETAAEYLQKTRRWPQHVITCELSRQMVPSSEIPEVPEQSLKHMSDEMATVFLREFNRASANKDMKTVTRFFRLLPMIGHEEEGLDVYARFVSDTIRTRSHNVLEKRNSAARAAPTFYGLAMASLFENIATLVAQHSVAVDRHYGQGRMLRVVERMQYEADSQGGLIIDTFWDERNFQSVLNDITQKAGGKQALEKIDIILISQLIVESAMMFNRWALYRGFVASRWPESRSDGSGPPTFLLNSVLARKYDKDFSSGFIVLVSFASKRSVEKALQLEEIPPLSTNAADTFLATSLVDDIMYTFTFLLDQTLAVGHELVCRQVFSKLTETLETDLLQVLQTRLKEEARALATQPSMSRSQTMTSISDSSARQYSKTEILIIHLNTLVMLSQNINKVITHRSKESYKELKRQYPFDEDAARIQQHLELLRSTVDTQCTAIATEGAQAIFTQVLSTRLQGIYSNMTKGVDYVVAPTTSWQLEEADTLDESHQMGRIFEKGWSQVTREYQELMCPQLYNQLVSIVANNLSRKLERYVWTLKGKVNELGAIRLDRDVSAIISKVSEVNYGLREVFIRVAQIVMIIGLENEEEEEGINWMLTDEERKNARNIRLK